MLIVLASSSWKDANDDVKSVMLRWEAWHKSRLPLRAEFIVESVFKEGNAPRTKTIRKESKVQTVAALSGERRSRLWSSTVRDDQKSRVDREYTYNKGRWGYFTLVDGAPSLSEAPSDTPRHVAGWLYHVYGESQIPRVSGPFWASAHLGWKLSTTPGRDRRGQRLSLEIGPAEVEIDLDGGDRCFPLRFVYRYNGSRDPETKPGSVIEWTEVWTFGELEPAAPIHFRRMFGASSTKENGIPTQSWEMRINRVSVSQVVSEIDLAPSLTIPNGTFVQVDDKPSIRHEWRDGQIVVSENKEAIAPLKEAVYFTEKRPFPWWPWAACASVAATLGFYWYRRR